jgi:acyl carrier protein
MNYLDSFVRSMNLKGNGNWISVNWDAWDFGDVEGTTDRRERALSPQEGVALFRQLMSYDRLGQIVVSTGNLSQRLQRWVRHRHSAPTAGAVQQQRHPRPPLETEYVAPRTTLEQAISEVWQESLGLNQVGVHDDYLDLGGDSLLAGHIVVQLRRRLTLPITVRSMFDNDTVAQLADHIDKLQHDSSIG